MLMNLLARLGQNPKNSLAIFLRGIALFFLAVFFIAIGYVYHPTWQLLGLTFLFMACCTAIWGYIGIFANRWYHILKKKR
jgi:Kef-type K+ transport system membrane component KefB